MEYKKISNAGNRFSIHSMKRILLLTVSFLLLFGMTVQAVMAQEVIQNGFEDGSTDGWSPRGGDVMIESVTEAANSGSSGLKVTGRTSSWHGASLNLAGVLSAGALYDIGVYVKLVDGQPASTLNMTVQRSPVGGDTQYEWVASGDAETDWIFLQGNYSFTGGVTDLLIYIESSDDTAEYYIDDFSINMIAPPPDPSPGPPGIVVENGFEAGSTDGWAPRGSGVVIESVTEAANSGDSSLKVTGRTANWNGASLDLADTLLQDAVYEITAYAKLVDGQPATNVSMTIQRSPVDDDTQYEWLASAAAEADWVMLQGSYAYTGAVSGLIVYIEAQEDTTEYYIDDFSITMISPPPLDQSGLTTDFEDGTVQGWTSRMGVEVVETTTEDSHGGLYALRITGREHTYGGPSIDVLEKMHTGSKYTISVWIKLLPGEADCDLRVSIQRSLEGTTTYNTLVPNTPVSENEWVQLTTDYTMGNEADTLSLYIEADSGTSSFYIDDFELSYIQAKPVQTDIPSLKEALAEYFPIGAALAPTETTTLHNELLKRHFSSLTAANVMKPDALQRVEGEFNFTNADIIVNFAKENGMQIRGHTLLWHNQTPDWFFQDADGNDMDATPENRTLLIQRLETHISTVVDYYKDDIFAWDVVNEVIDASQPDGLRRSKWYEIIGPEYIDLAFRFARAADSDALLYINDYNTVASSSKRDIYYDFVAGMLDRGVPIDGVGHQLHIDINSPSAYAVGQTIEMFGSLGLDNQITEMDMSIYPNSTDSYTEVPEEIIIKQGYRYKEIFDELKRLKDYISSVTMWGIADDNTWLKSFPITRINLPLLFDEELQAKPAFWGIVDPGQLPMVMNRLDAPEGQARIDGKTELRWDIMPWVPVTPVGLREAAFKAMWRENKLFIIADVLDPVKNRKDDLIEIFIDKNNGKTGTYEEDDTVYRFPRWGRTVNGIKPGIYNHDWGYRFEVALPMDIDMVLGTEIGLDLRFTDAENPDEVLSWNDITNSQDADTSKYGTLVLAKKIGLAKAPMTLTRCMTIDGEIEQVWKRASATEIETATWVQGTTGATAKVRTMWDPFDKTFYLLAEVTDSLLSDASANVWEQDSIEIFIDQNNGKTSHYESDDAQYRINFNNIQSFGGAANADSIISATSITSDGYIVEAAITFDSIELKKGLFFGFDIQVNDDGLGDGVRSSVATWNDPYGTAYQNTENFGALILTRKAKKIKYCSDGGYF